MPAVCSDCGFRNGFTCCELAPGTPNASRFPLTQAEIMRVAKALFVDPMDVVDIVPSTPPHWRSFFKALHPGFMSLLAHESTFVLPLVGNPKISKGGEVLSSAQCKFLRKGHGCVLSKSARPHHCRLYPLWFKGDGVTAPFSFYRLPGASAACLAVQQAPDDERLIAQLGQTRADLVQTARQFLADTAAEAS